jgi:hypothetical protein
METKGITIAIDFDGTCVSHEFPKIGKDIGAIPILKELVYQGHKLILFTMRSDIDNPTSDDYNIHAIGGKYLTEAINWFNTNDIHLSGINVNPQQKTWTTSPKAYAQLYIDDAALGCPLITNYKLSDRPFADWIKIKKMLIAKKILL